MFVAWIYKAVATALITILISDSADAIPRPAFAPEVTATITRTAFRKPFSHRSTLPSCEHIKLCWLIPLTVLTSATAAVLCPLQQRCSERRASAPACLGQVDLGAMQLDFAGVDVLHASVRSNNSLSCNGCRSVLGLDTQSQDLPLTSPICRQPAALSVVPGSHR